MDPQTSPSDEQPLTYRMPVAEDGPDIRDLIDTCHPLDKNSLYCNLLQCTHFADTSIIAERAGKIVGWISGYIPPAAPDTLFIWQVAVAPEARGMGLALRLLNGLLARDGAAGLTRLQTTITDDNAASWALFRRLAMQHGATLTHQPHFTRDTHFAGDHATEHMVSITFANGAKRAA